MGTWGTGISSNDTFGDVYDEFFDYYNDGMSVKEISEELINLNWETLDIPEDANNFWFALALSQWKCKALEESVLKRVEHIIISKSDLEIWKESGASNSDLKKIIINDTAANTAFLLAGLKFTSYRFSLIVHLVIFTKTSYNNARQKYPTVSVNFKTTK